jgi:hypothetical protein
MVTMSERIESIGLGVYICIALHGSVRRWLGVLAGLLSALRYRIYSYSFFELRSL